MSRIARGQQVSWHARVRSWELWTTPRAMLWFVLVTEIAVAVATVASIAMTSPDRSDLLKLALLIVLGVAFDEISTRIARLRARLAAYSIVEMTSVWTFAGAVVLPVGYAALLCGAIIGLSWLRHGRRSGDRPYRRALTASAAVAACFAARGAINLFESLGGSSPRSVVVVLGVSLGIVVYLVVNAGVLHTAIYLAMRPASIRQLWASARQEASLEIATLCLGGLAALALVYEPLLVLLAIPPMFVLQRSVLTKELEVAATTDAKTGLLNASTWHHVAGRELARAERERQGAAVLIVDMDNFKRVNDNFGHLVGDDVLKAVAGCLTEEMRQYDSIGRFGGEEFVAVLSEVDELAALGISERIRTRIAELEVPSRDPELPPLTGLSVSIGVACYPVHGIEVEDLLHAADSALYSAKRAGRNRVELSVPRP